MKFYPPSNPMSDVELRKRFDHVLECMQSIAIQQHGTKNREHWMLLENAWQEYKKEIDWLDDQLGNVDCP